MKLGTPREILRKLLPDITEKKIIQLEEFVRSLLEWNQRHNLISRKDENHIWEYHIFPSLVPLNLVKFPSNCWLLDIGSGGGLPAIPIKIVRPDLQMLLVDSVRKKTLFLQKMILDLQLNDIAVKRERIETLQRDENFIQRFDMVTARAVADIPQLVGWSKPFLKRKGFVLLWKGLIDVAELEASAKELKFDHAVFPVPDRSKNLSTKFEELGFFRVSFGVSHP